MFRSLVLIVVVLAGVVIVPPGSKLAQQQDKQEQFPKWAHPDDGPGRSFEEDKPRIDRFAEEMKSNKTGTAYIIAYAGLVSYKNEARIRLRCIRNYLTSVHKIPRSRLRLIDGGYGVEVRVRLYLINPGDPIPTPYSFVNREAVRMRKPPKSPCGKPV